MDNAHRQAKLAAQIEIRLKVLGEWDINGVPQGYSLPSSLNKVREWAEPKLGIEKIGSPSSFTTSHKQYGRDVSRIAKLLVKLNAPTKRKPKSNPAKMVLVLRAKLDAQEDSLAMAANQYTSLRHELDKYLKLYRVARQSQEEAQQELTVVEVEVQKLKAELVRERAKAGRQKVSSIDFRGRDDGKS